MNKEKKNSVGALIFAVIIIAVIVVLYVATHIDLMFHAPKDLMGVIEEKGSPVKGEYVSVDVDAVVDCYAETKHRINGIIPIGTDTHYILWLEDGSFISLQAKGKKDIKKLNDIMDETQEYLYGTSEELPGTYELSGVISTMDPEIEGYYRQCLDLWGIDSTVGTIYYIQIDETNTKLGAWLIVGVFVIIEIVAVISLISAIKEKKQEKLAAKAAAMAAPITDDNNNLYS